MIDTDRLKQEVDALNQVSYALNRNLESIEKELQEIGTGLTVWIRHETDEKILYGYCKFSDGWHLAVKIEDGEPQAILRSARFHRYMCFKLRQKIVDALVEITVSTTDRWSKSLEGEEDELHD